MTRRTLMKTAAGLGLAAPSSALVGGSEGLRQRTRRFPSGALVDRYAIVPVIVKAADTPDDDVAIRLATQVVQTVQRDIERADQQLRLLPTPLQAVRLPIRRSVAMQMERGPFKRAVLDRLEEYVADVSSVVKVVAFYADDDGRSASDCSGEVCTANGGSSRDSVAFIRLPPWRWRQSASFENSQVEGTFAHAWRHELYHLMGVRHVDDPFDLMYGTIKGRRLQSPPPGASLHVDPRGRAYRQQVERSLYSMALPGAAEAMRHRLDQWPEQIGCPLTGQYPIQVPLSMKASIAYGWEFEDASLTCLVEEGHRPTVCVVPGALGAQWRRAPYRYGCALSDPEVQVDAGRYLASQTFASGDVLRAEVSRQFVSRLQTSTLAF